MVTRLSPPVRLSNANLASLPPSVDIPRYDRAGLRPGLVHIGLGNFHRAHQAWYTHRLMQQGMAQDWAILGAGVMTQDAATRDRLKAQDCLTTLIELSPTHRMAEVTGPMVDFLPVEEGHGRLIAAMSDPAIRIVALTVTEGGYFRDPLTGAFDLDHTDIRHDAAHPDTPRTAFGAMVAALRRRRAAGHGPFSGLSCDNLTGNGDILRQVVVGLARLTDPGLADWIEGQGAFPNSMVDCIVPATGEAELALSRELGIQDAAPVTHENYRQWVLEDRFCAGRPDWDRVGATFTADVHPYEAMKIRVLNAGHQVLANAGELLSLPTIADCMVDPDLSAFFRKVQVEEILPHVAPVPGMSPQSYLDLIERRFANPAIRDTTRRVAFDGYSRHSGFVLPIIQEALTSGGPVDGLALVEALWARMCAGRREDGTAIAPNDPQWDMLNETALKARERPVIWLERITGFAELAGNTRFAKTFERSLSQLWETGTRHVLSNHL